MLTYEMDLVIDRIIENEFSQYFHPDPSSIVKAMSQALARVATEEPSGAEEAEPDAIMCSKLMPISPSTSLYIQLLSCLAKLTLTKKPAYKSMKGVMLQI